MLDKCIFIFILLLPCGLFAQNIADVLRKCSTSDKRALEKLFHILIDEDHFGYTLFGDKPVSLSGDCTITPYEVALSGIPTNELFWKKWGIPSGGLFWRKWSIWKKIEKDLCIKNYFFIEEPAFNRNDGAMGFVFLVNKKAFVETVDQNIETFRDILGQNTTAIKLLEKVEEEKTFMKHLKNSELLLGILLGYGSHNAQLFVRIKQLRKFISAKDLILIEIKPLPSQGFSSIEEEEKFLNQKLQPFSRHVNHIPWMILPVQFAADLDHIETKLLQKKYARLRNEISRRCAEKNNFLELIISQLTADQAPAYQPPLGIKLNSRDTVATIFFPYTAFFSLKSSERARSSILGLVQLPR